MVKKEIYVNLNFDDFNPQFDKEGDFGGLGGPNLERILKLLEDFPELKISMFTVPNWIDRPHKTNRYFYKFKEIFRIFPVIKPNLKQSNMLRKNTKWCDLVRDLILKNRLELAPHGYFHFNPYKSIHGQEFLGLSKEATKQRLLLTEEEFTYNKLPFVKAFRPPGWGTNIYLTRVLKELDYKIYAPLSSRSKTNLINKEDDLDLFPQNWSIRESKEEALRIAKEAGILLIKGHIAYKHGNEIIENGMKEEYWNNLIDTLKELSSLYEVKYLTIEEVIKHQK